MSSTLSSLSIMSDSFFDFDYFFESLELFLDLVVVLLEGFESDFLVLFFLDNCLLSKFYIILS